MCECCYKCDKVDKLKEIQTTDGFESYCEQCVDEYFVYVSELGCMYDKTAYITNLMDSYIDYKKINREHSNIELYIHNKNKKQLKDLLKHFGKKISYFDKRKKADIIELILKCYRNNWE